MEAYEAQLFPEIMKTLPPKRSFPHILEETKFFLCLEEMVCSLV